MTELLEIIEKTKASSAYAYGDPDSWRVPLSNSLYLPGARCPVEYLDHLGFQGLAGKHVAIVCPSTGGLVAEAALRSAASVVAIEPRVMRQPALSAALPVMNQAEVTNTTNIRTFPHWPSDAHVSSIGNVDYVIWASGLEECPSPAETLRALLMTLNKGGALLIEVAHGSHGLPHLHENAWRPTPAAFAEGVEKLTGAPPQKVGDGRLDGYTVYRINAVVEVGEVPGPAGPEEMAMPRPEESKVLIRRTSISMNDKAQQEKLRQQQALDDSKKAQALAETERLEKKAKLKEAEAAQDDEPVVIVDEPSVPVAPIAPSPPPPIAEAKAAKKPWLSDQAKAVLDAEAPKVAKKKRKKKTKKPKSSGTKTPALRLSKAKPEAPTP